MEIDWSNPSAQDWSGVGGHQPNRGDGLTEKILGVNFGYPDWFTQEIVEFQQKTTSGNNVGWAADALYGIKTNIDASQNVLPWTYVLQPTDPPILHLAVARQMTVLEWNNIFSNSFVQAVQNVANVCPNDENVWQLFYSDYHRSTPSDPTIFPGAQRVEDYINYSPAKPGPACQAALRDNDSLESERTYRILNDPSTEDTSTWHGENDVDFGIYSGDSNRATDSSQAAGSNITHLRTPKISTANSYYFFGDPTLDLDRRKQQLASMMPVYPAGPGVVFLDAWAKTFDAPYIPPQHPGQTPPPSPPSSPPPEDPTAERLKKWFGSNYSVGEPNPTTNPLFMGNLPKLPIPIVAGMHPFHDSTGDTNTGYTNHCNDPTILQEIVPILAAMLGMIGGELLPLPEYAKLVGVSTLGATGYFTGRGVAARGDGAGDFDNAALLLSVGSPISAWLLIEDITNVAGSTELIAAGCVVAGGTGYLLLQPIILPVLSGTGGVASFLFSVVNGIETFARSFVNGCAAHVWASHLGECLTDDAQDKEKMQDVWLDQFYGVTGQQRVMRKECLRKAMTTEAWGDDPHNIGEVDMSNGTMTNPAACMPADYWPFQYTRPQGDPLVDAMWGQVAPCFDATNPAFLPPVQ